MSGAEPLAGKTLLVSWPAADWKVLHPLLDAGLLPNLEQLVDAGVIGDLASLEPVVCPLTRTSLVTGRRADRHGILGFVEPDPAGDGVRPVTSTSRTAEAIWNILDDQGLACIVVGWPHPAEPVRGACVSEAYRYAVDPLHAPWPLPPGTVFPSALAEPLAELRVHPAELATPQLLPFVPTAGRIDQVRDARLSAVARLVAECSSVHAAATWLMENVPWDFLAVDYQAIEAFSQDFMAYHPPRMARVSETDFETYRDVVKGAYRFHDMMLGRLLELAGTEATVVLVSDHGYHSDHLRPEAPASGPVLWHRKPGVIVMKGPGIRRDERVYGAGLLDVVPTLLSLLGLPLADDLEGQPLLQALEAPASLRRIAGREDPAAPAPSDREASTPAAGWDGAAVVAKLAALGHIEDAGDDAGRSARLARRDARYNLARVHLEAGRPEAAAAALEGLTGEFPDDPRFATLLALARYQRGDLAGARALLAEAPAAHVPSPLAVYVTGRVLAAEGRTEEALRHLEEARRVLPGLPGVHCEIGNLYLQLGRWDDATAAFRRELELDATSPFAHGGLAAARLEQGRPHEAADEALRAIGLLHDYPEAHLRLGVALLRAGQPLRGARALETCLALRPETPQAHRWLAIIHESTTGNLARAAEHRRMAAALDGAGDPDD